MVFRLFTLYSKREVIKISNQIREKIASAIANALIILLLTVSLVPKRAQKINNTDLVQYFGGLQLCFASVRSSCACASVK